MPAFGRSDKIVVPNWLQSYHAEQRVLGSSRVLGSIQNPIAKLVKFVGWFGLKRVKKTLFSKHIQLEIQSLLLVTYIIPATLLPTLIANQHSIP